MVSAWRGFYISSSGFDPAKVVFDSPVKTPKDIKEAIDLGLHMNLDNELEVKSYIKSNDKAK